MKRFDELLRRVRLDNENFSRLLTARLDEDQLTIESERKRAIEAEDKCNITERRLAEAARGRNEAERRLAEAEHRANEAVRRLREMEASNQRSLGMRAARLVEKAEQLGDFGAEFREVLEAWRKEKEDAEQRSECLLNEIETRLQGPHEKCVLCQCVIRHGERVVRLPCLDVYHEECMLPKLQDGTVTRCPLCRVSVNPAVINVLPVFSWGD